MIRLNLLHVLSLMLLSLPFVVGCNDDEPGDNDDAPAETLELTCDYQGLDALVHRDSTLVLEDRGSGVDYTIDCRAKVRGDLIIEPGVTIAFGSSGSLVVYGSLEAVGVEDNQIVFTGQDKVRGSWGFIAFDSDDVKNRMAYCVVEYGGGYEYSSNGDRGNVLVISDARATIDNCTIQLSETYGLRIPSHSAEIPSLNNNTFTQNDIPVYIPANHVSALQDGSYTGNDDDAILIRTGGFGNSATINEPAFWNNLNAPYRVAKSIRVTSDVLTIAAGTTIEFENGTSIEVGDGDAAGLVCVGTAASPITLTGTTAAAGAWDGLIFNFTNNPLNEVGFATIEYAGSVDAKGAIYTWAEATVNVHDVTFKDIETCAFYAAPSTSNPNSNLTETNNTTENVGGGYLCGS